MVFLRPTIVNTPQQADAVTRRQYESLRTFDGLDPIVLRALTEEMDRSVAPSAEAPNLAPVP
jgi:type II secretory pathway component GspD/PulD (secretin)